MISRNCSTLARILSQSERIVIRSFQRSRSNYTVLGYEKIKSATDYKRQPLIRHYTNTVTDKDIMVREWRRLRKVDENTYIGEADSEHPQARVFGGHVASQAMSAAYFTAPEGFFIHSVHCYFIRGGEESVPIKYSVKRIRDGRNFSIRYVEAEQHGKVVLMSEFSLQRVAAVTDSFTMSPPFPKNLPPPEKLISNLEGRNRLIMQGVDPMDLRGQYTERMAPCVELRPCDIDMYLNGTDGVNKKQYFWIRYKNPVDKDDFMLRHASLVYMSDIGPVVSGSLCHKEKRFKLSTSLDHSTWFHQFDFDINEWILYETECVANSKHRSLINGRMWSREGRLLMSTSQEALIYKTPKSNL